MTDKSKSRRLSLLLVFLVLVGGCSREAGNSPVASGNRGIVVSVHPIASRIGLDVLRDGGNAIDAAVATGLALGVVDQFNSGLGGGAFILIRMADVRVLSVDGREKAPAGATRNMYIKDGTFNQSLSQKGPLAVGVPGLLAAFEKALEIAGTQSLSQLIRPSIEVARRGFKLDSSYVSRYQGAVEDLRRDPASRDIYFHADGSPLEAGEIFKQADLAQTYREISLEGTDYFYRGGFALRLAHYMEKNGGLITYEDMTRYNAVVREPIIGRYQGYEIIGMGPPGSGGVHVVQMLNMIEASGVFHGRPSWDSESIFWVSRFMDTAFRDRADFLGDSDFYPVPVARLTSKAYADSVVSVLMTQEENVVASVDHQIATLPPGHTTNLCVIDRWGNAVVINQTVNLSYGAKVTVPGTGVALNCQMDDFSAQPGLPNYFGLVGSEANAIEPEKRPLSSMSPTIVVRDNKPVLILGGAGGPRIITAVLQVMVNFLDLDMELPDALAHPRFHHQFKPEVLFVEKRSPQWVVSSQEARGREVQLKSGLGSVRAIGWDDGKKVYVGAADPRSRGSAAAF